MSLGLAAAPPLAACDDPAAGGQRRRWACWRSPAGQPSWARPALLGIALLAALLFGWNITSAGLAPFYSVAVKSMTIPHTAYMAALAPPLAALSGAGIVLLWRWYRAGGRRAWLAPAVVAAELAWSAYLWSGYPAFLPWARWLALAAGVAAVTVLVVARGCGGGCGRGWRSRASPP